jgi:predicted HTH domain antitoxin
MRTVEIKVPESISEYDVRLAMAVDAFYRGLVSLNMAAEIAGVPLQQFVLELRKRGITAFPYSDEEAQRELHAWEGD